MILVGGHCWGHGSQAVGHRFRMDVVRCRRCGRKLTKNQLPQWFEAEPLEEAECLTCLRKRHDGCPCGFRDV